MMKSPRIWALIAIAILVAVNVWIFYPTKQRPLSRQEKEKARLEFIENERRTWADSKVVSLDDPSLASIIQKLQSEGCLELPKGAKPIAARKLDEDAQRDLPVAIAGLCRAYLVDTGRSVIEYMHERGEPFAPDRAAFWREVLRKMGRSVPGPGPDEAVKLAAAIYQSLPIGAHWKSLRPDGSCWRVYRVTEYGDKTANSLGVIEADRWEGIRTTRHSFEPTHTLQDELKASGALLLCDVKLVIDQDAKLRGATVPYYVRFWWSTADRHWHPLDMASIPKDLDHMGLAVHLLF